jgi:hypothetical protein
MPTLFRRPVCPIKGQAQLLASQPAEMIGKISQLAQILSIN